VSMLSLWQPERCAPTARCRIDASSPRTVTASLRPLGLGLGLPAFVDTLKLCPQGVPYAVSVAATTSFDLDRFMIRFGAWMRS
jgi:hypothetical protein